jgi:hypothetical protein
MSIRKFLFAAIRNSREANTNFRSSGVLFGKPHLHVAGSIRSAIVCSHMTSSYICIFSPLSLHATFIFISFSPFVVSLLLSMSAAEQKKASQRFRMESFSTIIPKTLQELKPGGMTGQ